MRTDNSQGELQHNLKGFSGRTLEVWRLGGRSFVRKTVQDPKRNYKLFVEFDKLQKLAQIANETKLFHVPELIRDGVDGNGLAFYDIGFVPSWELDSRLPQLNSQQIDGMVHRLSDIITVFSATALASQAKDTSDSAESTGELDFILGKFQETRVALQSATVRWPQAHQLVTEYTERLQQLVILPESLPGMVTFCHGDLALDNVLIGRDWKVYLIDPLVNGHESFLWDVSKVFQSSLVQWRQIKHGEFDVDLARRKISLNLPERVSLFNARFYESITQMCRPNAVTLYLAVTVARVVKYAQTFEQLCALLILTNELLDRYINRRYDLDEPISSLCR